ncbi:hypothetical protein Dda_1336 [Drechslerella dactyloides]|uniref:Uncharacterized protein n=1 Tax=Drechslerella dactyloides TaxID=74499 RepID=A0AAD6NLD2_DREDA|nr:hypothetical protein Dda_1336 [Drechslerella dactyloides]
MYYILYLSSLCRRRRWPDPHYEILHCNGGYSCVVRVNHREYYCENVSESEVLAREAAAQRAYQFSVNESQFAKAAGVIVAPSKAIYASAPIIDCRENVEDGEDEDEEEEEDEMREDCGGKIFREGERGRLAPAKSSLPPQSNTTWQRGNATWRCGQIDGCPAEKTGYGDTRAKGGKDLLCRT